MKNIINQIAQKIIVGNFDEFNRLVDKAIKQDVDVNKLMQEGFIKGLNVVGEKFTKKEYFLPDMLVSGMMVQEGLKKIRPLILKSKLKYKGIVVAGTVLGDMHDIGKKMVCMMLEGSGFKVVDIGVDVSAEQYLNAAIDNKGDIIALSALLSTTRLNMGKIISDIRRSKPGNHIKIIVGGASITQDFAVKIGADGYAPDAGTAVLEVGKLLTV
ncbi:MAG: cobalamin-dependent protein [Actinobacteria bacterium]|nr:cobalamin-dependent protein [Actinomycetota bacterium]